MGTHYFRSQGGGSDDSLRHFAFTVRDKTFSWTSLAGVFSCKRADRGGLFLLDALLDAEIDEGAVLDLGCGHGQVGLPLAVFRPKLTMTLVDVNEEAVASARTNGKRLALEGIDYVVSDGVTGFEEDQRFQVVALNPPVRAGRTLVHRLADEGWQRLSSGGRLFVVLRVKQGAWRFLDHLLDSYDENALVVLRKKGYVVMVATKPKEKGQGK